jgi:peroxiredoxin
VARLSGGIERPVSAPQPRMERSTMKALPVVVVVVMALAWAPRAFAEEIGQPKNVPWDQPPRKVHKLPFTLDPLNNDAPRLTPGDHVPDFRAPSSLDRQIREHDLTGHWSAIVFDDSAKPFAQINALEDSLSRLDVSLYGVSRVDSVSLSSAGAKKPLRMVLIADPDGNVSRAFGMYDESDDQIEQGLLVADARGIIRMSVRGASMDPGQVLQMIQSAVKGT